MLTTVTGSVGDRRWVTVVSLCPNAATNLPRELAVLLDNLPVKQRADLAPRIAKMSSIAPVDGNERGAGVAFVSDTTVRWRAVELP
jgi:hypothetical protein